jgi:hypothetical protein
MELYQFFGSDIKLSETSTLKMVSGDEETQQRIFRRLLTAKQNYLWHLDYGAGLPSYVGRNLTQPLIAQLKGLIKTQIFLEATVERSPEPVITLNQQGNNLICTIEYVSKPSGQIYTLSFTVSE